MFDKNSTVVTTSRGRCVDLKNFSQSDVDIKEVAHALSHICRFSGHTNRFYSVASHCLAMADYGVCMNFPTETVLQLLLHDAPEAYHGDITRPVRELFGISLQWSWERSVYDAFGQFFFGDSSALLPPSDVVKEVDDLFCVVEGSILIGGPLWEVAKARYLAKNPQNEDAWDTASRLVSGAGSQAFKSVADDYYHMVLQKYAQMARERSLDKPLIDNADLASLPVKDRSDESAE